MFLNVCYECKYIFKFVLSGFVSFCVAAVAAVVVVVVVVVVFAYFYFCFCFVTISETQKE